MGHQLDSTIRDGKMLYGIVEPFLRQYTDTSRLNRGVTDVARIYDDAREKAMGFNENLLGLGGALTKAGY